MVDEAKAAGRVWDWRPLVSAGPVRFGQEIADVEMIFRLVQQRRRVDVDGEWIWYGVEGTDYSLLTENGRVTSVSGCEFVYSGRTLAGLTVAEVCKTFSPHPVERGEYPSDTTLEVKALDCLLTLDEESERVSTISVGGGQDD